MAVKKTTKKTEASAAPTKVEAKETAPKKAASAKPKKAAPAAAVAPAPVATPVAAAKKAAPKKAAPKKVAAPLKLSASQGDLLKKIGETSETGYLVDKKVELRSIESLLLKKLIKKGAKDKASGSIRYHISSTGKKHVATP